VSWDDIQYSERLMSTLTTLAKSDSTQQELQQKFQMSEAPQVEIDIPANTELMHITVAHGNPSKAAAAANALAEMLTAQLQMLHPQGSRSSAAIIRDQMAQIEQELSEARQDYEQRVINAHEDSEQLQNQWRVIELKERTYATLLDQYERARVADVLRANVVSVVSVAVPPTAPSSPNPMLNLALAVLVGLAGGIGLGFLLEYFDTTLYTSEQIADVTTWSTLAKIPQAPRGQSGLAIDDSVQGEAFRRLRTNFLSVGHGEKTFLITSADPGEGKSTISSNLAISIARSGRTVVLVDSDMRLPTVHKLFELPNVRTNVIGFQAHVSPHTAW
jgi:non-specific protein-tyrosine kinase